jgi:hypothetical protein
MSCGGAYEVGWKHEQRLTDAVPGIEAAATAVESELRVFLGKDLGLVSPKGVGYLQAVRGIGCAKLAGLDEKGKECGDEQEQGNRMRRSKAEHWSLWYDVEVRPRRFG